MIKYAKQGRELCREIIDEMLTPLTVEELNLLGKDLTSVEIEQMRYGHFIIAATSYFILKGLEERGE